MKKCILIFTAFYFAACTTLTPPPTLASLPTFTPAPPLQTPSPIITLTPLSAPTSVRTPTLTPPPPPTATPDCPVNPFLKSLKPLIAYAEFDLTYNVILNNRSLTIWFVEPKIELNAAGDQINKNAVLAQLSAATVSAKLATGDAKCLSSMVNVINPIVVDRNYNGWFSGIIKLSDASANVPLENKVNTFTVSYLRTKPAAPPSTTPAQSCKWTEARAKMQKHFASTRENVGFEFVIDETGINAYAQWDGEIDMTMIPVLLNVALESRCLHPAIDQLVVIMVDADGKINLIGQAPGSAVRSSNYANDVPNQFKILYPQQR
ncbi:MAG: hypothetical protein AAB261_05815 [Chloroflexota bacterium]